MPSAAAVRPAWPAQSRKTSAVRASSRWAGASSGAVPPGRGPSSGGQRGQQAVRADARPLRRPGPSRGSAQRRARGRGGLLPGGAAARPGRRRGGGDSGGRRWRRLPSQLPTPALQQPARAPPHRVARRSARAAGDAQPSPESSAGASSGRGRRSTAPCTVPSRAGPYGAAAGRRPGRRTGQGATHTTRVQAVRARAEGRAQGGHRHVPSASRARR